MVGAGGGPMGNGAGVRQRGRQGLLFGLYRERALVQGPVFGKLDNPIMRKTGLAHLIHNSIF